MKKQLLTLIIILFAINLFLGCSDEVTSSSNITGDWLIPDNLIFDGGPGKDGIPALSNPKLAGVTEIDFLDNNDLVIGIKIGDEIRAYPHPILDWHEIINDEIGASKFAVTYCPLTGSAIAWNRIINNQTTTFGVSGLLYNTNLIPYDRATGSNWSQMTIQCVNGSLIGMKPGIFPIIETSWQTWKEMYPGSKIVSSNTGYSRRYGSYPYGDYKTNHNNLIFPINNDDGRLPRKERILGIIAGDQTKVFRIAQFGTGMSILNENFNGLDIVVAGSADKNIAVVYNRRLSDGTVLTFSGVEESLPIVMTDNEGTNWDIFGQATSGPRAGQKLETLTSFISYWFAWGTFYPGAAIHGQ